MSNMHFYHCSLHALIFSSMRKGSKGQYKFSRIRLEHQKAKHAFFNIVGCLQLLLFILHYYLCVFMKWKGVQVRSPDKSFNFISIQKFIKRTSVRCPWAYNPAADWARSQPFCCTTMKWVHAIIQKHTATVHCKEERNGMRVFFALCEKSLLLKLS